MVAQIIPYIALFPSVLPVEVLHPFTPDIAPNRPVSEPLAGGGVGGCCASVPVLNSFLECDHISSPKRKKRGY